jgi:hypothetical protein
MIRRTHLEPDIHHFPHIKEICLKKISIILFMLYSLSVLSSCVNINRATIGKAETKHVIILVLGSNDPSTRATRVALACNLLNRGDIRFNRIILSGGCGAHGTNESNCEASDMERLLKTDCRDGVSGIDIYKEERSGSTIQNYCFSRKIEAYGKKLIEKGDTLYVVSSHYHALSVAACFMNEGVNACYYYTCNGNLYEGTPPSLETFAASADPCFRDYAGIAQNCGATDWCENQSRP